MKIAICYSGFLRDIQSTYLNLKKCIVGEHDIDFFIHTWDVKEYYDEINFAKNIIKPKIIFCEKQKPFEMNPYNFINSKVTPEEYQNELNLNRKKLYELGEDKKFFPPPSEENEFNFVKDKEVLKLWHYGCIPYNILSQYYSIHKSNELKKIYEYQNDIKYDCVMRMRSDLIFNAHIDPLNCDMNYLYALNRGSHRGTELNLCDLFAFSSSDNMDIYSDCFLFIPTIYFTYGTDFIPEILLDKYIQIRNIKTKKIPDIVTVIRNSLHKEKLL
jgi:hypothetical protein